MSCMIDSMLVGAGVSRGAREFPIQSRLEFSFHTRCHAVDSRSEYFNACVSSMARGMFSDRDGAFFIELSRE